MSSTNHFKFGASGISSATRGGFKVGVVGGVDYGPTSSTGFWNGVTPPVGGYTIYVDKASQGPSIHVANNDSQCIGMLLAMGATGSTIENVLAWADGQANMVVLSEELVIGDLPSPITHYQFGAPVTLYDFAATGSYSTTTSNVPDLSGNGNNGIFINGSGDGTPVNMSTYSTTSPGFVSIQSQVSIKSTGSGALLNTKQSYTYLMWFKNKGFSGGNYPGTDFGQFEWIINNDTPSWRTWHNRNGNYAMLNFNTGGVPAFSTTKYYLWAARYDGTTNIASVDMFMDGTRYGATVTSSGNIGVADGGPFRIGLRYNNWLQADMNYFAAYSSDIGTAGLQTIYNNTKSRFGY